MRTLACILTIAAIATAYAPNAGSGTNDEQRIANLEQSVNHLMHQANCERAGVPVTEFRRADGSRYLAASTKASQKFLWVLIMTPGCLHVHPLKSELGWRWTSSPSSKKRPKHEVVAPAPASS